jgi:hypothetical protein
MALRGRNWFFGRCFTQVAEFTPLAHLAHRALELGFGNDNTQGHVLQACGAAQKFLRAYPQHRPTLRREYPAQPIQIDAGVLRDWKRYFKPRKGSYHKTFGYNWSTLRGYLTRKYAGRRKGGGGGNNEFEIVLRIMAEVL